MGINKKGKTVIDVAKVKDFNRTNGVNQLLEKMIQN